MEIFIECGGDGTRVRVKGDSIKRSGRGVCNSSSDLRNLLILVSI